MMLKDYQTRVVKEVEEFFEHLDAHRTAGVNDFVSPAFASSPKYRQYPDRPITGAGKLYPRVCIKMPTGGGKTLIAVETIRAYQNIFAKRKTGLIVWITHRDQIYRQTIEHLQDKSHPYRQLLDQVSGNRTNIIEKGQILRRQDVEEGLVVLMLMIDSARHDTNKIFRDNGYTDFFPPEGRYDLHKKLLELIPNLDRFENTLFAQTQIKTSLGNTIRTQEPLIIVDEFHKMFTDAAQATLDGLNPTAIIGLSATPKRGMNIVAEVSGCDLEAEDMVKLDMHIIPPSQSGDWQSMLVAMKAKREDLEKKARKLELNEGVYIRPIALIQVERTGRDQRGHGFVHSEDVRELLVASGVSTDQIAVKSASLDEIREEKLLSKESEVRYIITKEALKEGWDCSFAYLLGVIPNARNSSSMTQLVGRILRQPYAKKTGVSDLDESYVFFASGHTEEVLKNVRKGFNDEGLGDVAGNIEVRDPKGKTIAAPQTVRIKKAILDKYPQSVYLPVWLVKEGSCTRRFSYDVDIRPRIEWSGIELGAWLKELVPTIGKTQQTHEEYLVDLEGNARKQEIALEESVRFDTLYLTRRLSETTENAFVAYAIATRVVDALDKAAKHADLDHDAGYIARELEKRLAGHRKAEEQAIFEKLLKAGILELVVSNDKEIGFAMPETDKVENSIHSSYTLGLYEDIDPSSLNTLESGVAQLIERSEHVIWWARNKVGREWYAVQGWHKGKVRPDFIIARKNKKAELEFVYIVETKGEQLTGNADTQYKDALFQQMNRVPVKAAGMPMHRALYTLNEHFDFELIPQGEEERRLRAKL